MARSLFFLSRFIPRRKDSDNGRALNTPVKEVEPKRSQSRMSLNQEATNTEHVSQRSYSDSAIPKKRQSWTKENHEVDPAKLQDEDSCLVVDPDNGGRFNIPLDNEGSDMILNSPIPQSAILDPFENKEKTVQVSIPQPLQLAVVDLDVQEPRIRAPNGDYDKNSEPDNPKSSRRSHHNTDVPSSDLEFSKMEGPDTSGVVEQDFGESDDDIDELSTLDHESLNKGIREPNIKELESEIKSSPLKSHDSERISKLQIRILGLRSYIQEKRRALREKQVAKSIADDHLIQFLRRHILGTLQTPDLDDIQNTISQLQEESERIRGEYGPLEDELNSLEDDLGCQEDEFLALLERSPIWQKDISSQHEQQEILDYHFYPASESSDESYIEDIVRKPHPLVSKYYSKLGDLDILRERLDENRDERDELEEGRNIRNRFGLTLAAEDSDFLDKFPALEKSLLEQIAKAEANAEKLKRKCLDRGLIDEDDEETDFATQELRSFNNDNDLDSVSEKSEFVKFPHLLPDPNRQVHFEDNTLPEEEKGDLRVHEINSWLLRQLRSSPLDVNLLAAIFESKGGKITDQWEADVLGCWYLDETRKNFTEGPPHSSVGSWTSTTPAIFQPTSEDKYNHLYSQFVLNGSWFTANTEHHWERPKSHTQQTPKANST
ncbi:hypothetical protein B7463_g5258, partial [Scytalidium lignicola]